MNTRIIGAVLVSLLVMAVAAPAQPAGIVISVQGNVEATAPDGTVRALILKAPLFLNDTIRSGPGARIQIMLNDDSVIWQGEKSEMVLDEYVYDPDRKKNNGCTLDLVAGIFRVVTGAITEMNPDRFKARTRLATIGIRGCELGFRVLEKREDVYIFYLPRGKRIIIEKTRLAEERRQERRRRARVLDIARDGIAVSIREGVPLEQRVFTLDEARLLIEGSLVPPATGPGPAAPHESIASTAMDGSWHRPQDARDTLASSVATRDQTISVADLVDRVSLGLRPTDATPSGPPPDITPDEPRLLLVGGTPFTDWEWAVWEDGRTTYQGNRYTGAAFLSAEQYRSIAEGTTTFNLSGEGTSGAVVDRGGMKRALQGTCSLSVSVGGPAQPEWHGTFDLGNTTGDRLVFGTSGIMAEGLMQGWLDEGRAPYLLVVGGQAFTRGDVTAHEIQGRLIRPPSGAAEITAAGGEYQMQHGGAASLHGAFGATLK